MIGVLIIDPNPAFAGMIQQVLEETRRFNATIVSTGAEAVAAVARAVFDVVLIESTLEDVSLKDLVVALRRSQPALTIVVILPFGVQTLPDAAKYFDVQGILSKPLYIPDLQTQIEEALTRPVNGVTPAPRRMVTAPPPPQAPAARAAGASAPPARPGPAKRPAPPPPAWLQDVNRAAQYLTALTLESSAEAALLMRGQHLIAFAGQGGQAEAQELSRMVAASWAKDHDASQGAQVRFLRLSDGADYLVYSTLAAQDVVLSMAFQAETPLGQIRKQAKRATSALFAPPPAPPAGPTEPEAPPQPLSTPAVNASSQPQSLPAAQLTQTLAPAVQPLPAPPPLADSTAFAPTATPEPIAALPATEPKLSAPAADPARFEPTLRAKTDPVSSAVKEAWTTALTAHSAPTGPDRLAPPAPRVISPLDTRPLPPLPTDALDMRMSPAPVDIANAAPTMAVNLPDDPFVPPEPAEVAGAIPGLGDDLSPSVEPVEDADLDAAPDWIASLPPTQLLPDLPDWIPVGAESRIVADAKSETDFDVEPLPDASALEALSRQLQQLERQSLVEQPPLLDLPPAPAANIRRTPHGLYDLSYSFIFVPRLGHITLAGDVKARLEQWLISLAEAHDWEATAIHVEPDHVELSLKCPPADSPDRIVKTILVETSEKIMVEYPRLAAEHAKRPAAFWSSGYYVVTPGRQLIPEEVRAFVEYQRREQGGKL